MKSTDIISKKKANALSKERLSLISDGIIESINNHIVEGSLKGEERVFFKMILPQPPEEVSEKLDCLLGWLAEKGYDNPTMSIQMQHEAPKITYYEYLVTFELSQSIGEVL